ncbi:hypothetical protein [Streptomyces sp. NPDC050759]|uniref:hypothetical protein n=1 Tax=Streptomyces sp. NPDC050759 TaxID=3365635 RepID=UPI0037B298A5
MTHPHRLQHKPTRSSSEQRGFTVEASAADEAPARPFAQVSNDLPVYGLDVRHGGLVEHLVAASLVPNQVGSLSEVGRSGQELK